MATYRPEVASQVQVVQKYGNAVVLCSVGSLKIWCMDANKLTTSIMANSRPSVASINEGNMAKTGTGYYSYDV